MSFEITNCIHQFKYYHAYFLTDVNECEDENGGCEAQCINTEGSYECRCPSGFRLGENRHECEGTKRPK